MARESSRWRGAGATGRRLDVDGDEAIFLEALGRESNRCLNLLARRVGIG
jgi:hypothetical protein